MSYTDVLREQSEKDTNTGIFLGIKNTLEYLYYNKFINHDVLMETIMLNHEFLIRTCKSERNIYDTLIIEPYIANIPVFKLFQSEEFSIWKSKRDIEGEKLRLLLR